MDSPIQVPPTRVLRSHNSKAAAGAGQLLQAVLKRLGLDSLGDMVCIAPTGNKCVPDVSQRAQRLAFSVTQRLYYLHLFYSAVIDCPRDSKRELPQLSC